MASTRETRVLFVPYRPGRAAQKLVDEGEISQQKHAAREYHRKAKEKRQTLTTQEVKHPSNGHVVQRHLRRNTAISRPVSPRNILGAGRVDPLNSLPIANMSPHAQEMLDFCEYLCILRRSKLTPTALTYQWPVFSFCNLGTTVQEMKDYIMWRIMSSAASLYTIVFAGATYWALRSPGRQVPEENLMLRLNYKNKALQTMGQEINELGPRVPNETLYTMLSLAAYGSAEKLEQPTHGENTSPLAVAHDLDFYCRLPCEYAHLRALSHVIRQRGNLKTAVDRPGFSVVIGIYDVLTSFQRLEAPAFPLATSLGEVMADWPAPQGESLPLNMTLGIGFNNLTSVPPFTKLNTIIDYLVATTIGWHRHQTHTVEAPTLYQIIRARTAIIHDLLCLLDLSTKIQSHDYCLYELCRLGTLAYVMLFLYPIPRKNGPHATLAQRLLAMLDFASGFKLWQIEPKFLIWATFMGGIMARDTPMRPWFVDRLNSPGIKHTLVSWTAVTNTLSNYLWLESECNHEGLLFWRDIWMTTQSRAASV